jgi:hypothetical protein
MLAREEKRGCHPFEHPTSHMFLIFLPLPLSSLYLDEADRDGDGLINEEDFLRIMKKTSLF